MSRSAAWRDDTGRPVLDRVPPLAFFLVSAVSHYLGPGLAVLLFAAVPPLGVGLLRIAAAALVFAAWRRPWRRLGAWNRAERRDAVLLGLTLAAMNLVFYLAIARLPLATVGAIEFLGPVALAAAGLRSRRNLAAFALAMAGVAMLTKVRIGGDPAGVLFAFANAALFVLYVLLGHRIAGSGGRQGTDRLAGAMLIACAAALPAGLADALPALRDPVLLAAAFGVGVLSSVIPYVCDQFAMARLPRASFALLLALLPAMAAAIGILLLHQVPGRGDVAGIALVMAGVALHRGGARAA
ncbi:MAG TPA: EamA family transporter [Dongiaceae bacterium]|nr:EamA family transporter [Dongiaceae bacterium]